MSTDIIGQIIKYNAQTNGRDKLCRLFQYGCRLIYGQLQSADKKDWVEKLKNMETAFSMTRKLLRFGKSLDFIKGAMSSIHLKDTVLRLTITLSKINQALYLVFDHLLWAHSVGVVKLQKQYWSEVSSRFYLTTLILNLVRDVYDLWNLLVSEMESRKSTRNTSAYVNGDSQHRSISKRERSVFEVVVENKPIFLDFVKNLFDLAIPMSTLGYVKLSASKQGLYGIISSYIAVLTIWNPDLKLVPS